MSSFLETITAIVGMMLILSLAAQAVQEAVKHSLAIKSWTRFTSIRRLVIEAARVAKLGDTDGEDIVAQVVDRLRRLSQNGVRKGKVRLDAMAKQDLVELIKSLDPAKVCALAPLGEATGKQRLADVAAEAEKWFELSQEPVADRYRRRMQLGAILSGLVIVLAVNADVFQLVTQMRKDPQLRQQVAGLAQASWSADSVLRVQEDSALALARDSATIAQAVALYPAIQTARGKRDSILLVGRSQSAAFLGYQEDWKPTWMWGLGIALSTLLVSLGAPFWHDVLEAVFGLKNKVRLESQADPGAAERKP